MVEAFKCVDHKSFIGKVYYHGLRIIWLWILSQFTLIINVKKVDVIKKKKGLYKSMIKNGVSQGFTLGPSE